jgi:hypothetical protein
MKRIILTLSYTVFITSSLLAQNAEDAIRNSFYLPGTTARNMAIGGANGSLGGDISSLFINPAGLGLYKTKEVVLSPNFNLNWFNNNYRGTETKEDGKNNIGYGTSGYVHGRTSQDKEDMWRSSAWSIGINQTANFNSDINYIGLNYFSSIADQFIDELVDARIDTNRALSDYIYGSSLAFRTYLIDARVTGNQLFYFRNPNPRGGLVQETNLKTRGGIHELALGYGANLRDRLYLGFSVGVPIGVYNRYRTYREGDASLNPNNDFNYVVFGDSLEQTSIGINAKLGAIYKPADKWRVGLAIHLPSWTRVSEKVWAGMTTDVEGYLNPRRPLTETSKALNSGNAGTRKYEMITPWKAMLSGSYVFNEVEDTRKQKAFVTADVEYIAHGATSFMQSDEDGNYLNGYYDGLNNVVSDFYKGAFNFRLGGEIKFNTIMVRLGGAYYGNPYDIDGVKAHRIAGSFGLGYRNKGMFIDLTYQHSWNKDVNFPYLLSSKANTFAEINQQRGNIGLTVGFKL